MTSSSAAGERIRYNGLDLLRFIAAAGVVLFHFGFLSWAMPEVTASWPVKGMPPFPEFKQFASVGWVGVECFFVISGFVICFSAQGSTAARFARSRFLRLAPALWVAAPLSALALLLHGVHLTYVWPALLKSVTLWPHGNWVDGAYWTLCLEVVFYGLVFLLLLLRQFARLELVVIAMGLVSSAACLWAVSPAPFAHEMAAALDYWPLRLLLVRNGCQFALGALIYFAFSRKASVWRNLAIGACLLGGMAETWLATQEALFPGQTAAALYGPVIIWLLMLAGLVLSLQPDMMRRLAHPRRAALLTTLGLATYPLYLIHETVGWVVLSETYRAWGWRWLSLALGLGAVLSFTVLIAKAEGGMRRSLGRWWDSTACRFGNASAAAAPAARVTGK